MKVVWSLISCIISLPLLVCSAHSTGKEIGNGETKGSSTTTVTAFSPTSKPLAIKSTSTRAIDVSSFLAYTSVSESSTLSAEASLQVAASSNTISPAAMSSIPAHSSHALSHRALIIVLSTVLGSVGLFLVIGTFLFLCHYRRGRRPFSKRGASPINDEEIASWRLNSEKKPQPPPPVHKAAIREVNPAIPLSYSQGWTWTATPTGINTVENSPIAPAFMTRAPNARRGLTDETVPGAEPFLAHPNRQSSRLSKAPPMGHHHRTRSSRSSVSGKSMWSINSPMHNTHQSLEKPLDFISSPTWYDADSDRRSSQMRDKDTEQGSISPQEEFGYDNFLSGGLSPRPRSQHRVFDPRDIGRAIS